MYPDTTPISDDQQLLRRRRLVIGLIAGFILVAIVLVIAFLLQSRHEEYSLTKTPLKSQKNFGYVSGDNLYAFNGLAFTKTSLQSNTTSVLMSGQRLPIPSSVYWANDKGALLNFSSSFYYTQVESKLDAMGEHVSYNGNNYTWYLDFKSGDLKLVAKSPIIANLATYSEQDGGFYYVPNIANQAGVSTSIRFFNTSTYQDKEVANNLLVTDASFLRPGADKNTATLVARDLSDTSQQKLYLINQNGKVSTLTGADKIYPTNSTDAYLITKAAASTTSTNDSEADIGDEPAYLYRTNDKKTISLGFQAGTADAKLYFVNGSQFFAVKGNSSSGDANSEQAVYYSGEVKNDKASSTSYPIQYSDKAKFDSQITKITGFSSTGQILVTNLNDDQLLFGTSLSHSSIIATKSQQDATDIVKKCSESSAQSQEYYTSTNTFRIFFVTDAHFAKNVSAFTSCVTSKDTTGLAGYLFQFTGTDSNGRIVTD